MSKRRLWELDEDAIDEVEDASIDDWETTRRPFVRPFHSRKTTTNSSSSQNLQASNPPSNFTLQRSRKALKETSKKPATKPASKPIPKPPPKKPDSKQASNITSKAILPDAFTSIEPEELHTRDSQPYIQITPQPEDEQFSVEAEEEDGDLQSSDQYDDDTLFPHPSIEEFTPLPINTQAFASNLANASTPNSANNVLDIDAIDGIDEEDFETDSEGEEVEEFGPPMPNPLYPAFPGISLPYPLRKESLSDFILSFALWAELTGLRNTAYRSQISVLKILQHPELHTLPKKLTTLQRWCRERLPLIPIQSTMVPVTRNKLPTGTRKRLGKTKRQSTVSKRPMYYFDIRLIVTTILSAGMDSLHTGMGEYVDSPSELWQSPAWMSSIRTCSQDFIRYPDKSPVIPSDFIHYFCHVEDCEKFHSGHNGHVLSFGKDLRRSSPTKNQVIIRVQPVLSESELSTSVHYRALRDFVWGRNELLLLEGADVDIQPSQLHTRRNDIYLKRNAQRRGGITRVFNIIQNKERSVSLLRAVRGELEVEALGRATIVSLLEQGIKSYPIFLFIDDFGLYRTAYHALTGIYMMPAGLPIHQRQRPTNSRTLTLGPHGAEFNDIVDCLRTSLRALDQGCPLNINGQEQLVWAPVLCVLGDMKGQNTAAGFRSPRSNYCCRFCNVGKKDRGDMARDFIVDGRYHHTIQAMHKQNLSAATLNKRGFLPKPSQLLECLPALDAVLGFPPDPAHSEYYGLVRRLFDKLMQRILAPIGVAEYVRIFNNFPFPNRWSRIPSPETHRGSWTMSECGQASVINPLVLRSFLKLQHLRPDFLERLRKEWPRENRPDHFTDVDFVIHGFGRIAKSNTLISSFKLSERNRHGFQVQIISARKYFLAFMNAAHTHTSSREGKGKVAPKAIPRKAPRRSVSLASIDSNSTESIHSSQDDEDEAADLDSILLPQYEPDDSIGRRETHAALLPNYHVGFHFDMIKEEYGVLWNANVLWGEAKHKVFKHDIIATNKRKPERQLLRKELLRSTLSALIEGSFSVAYPELSTQITRIQKASLELVEGLLTSLQVNDDDDEDEERDAIASSSYHTYVLVRGKLNSKALQKKGLPGKMTRANQTFHQLIEPAMISYGLQTTSWGTHPLYWYEQCSYAIPSFRRRFTVHIGDYITLDSGLFAHVLHIFTHQMQYEESRRVFLWIQVLKTAPYIDGVLNLPIFHQIGEERIVPLKESTPGYSAYMIPIPQSLNSLAEPHGGLDLLHCDWEIHFA